MNFGEKIKMLELKELRCNYNDSVVFDFSLKLELGQSLAVIGPSGAGKSTFLNLIAGFIKPTSGDLSFNGENLLQIDASKRPVNILFQDNNVFNHLNVAQNVALGIAPNLKLNNNKKDIVNDALKKVGLEGFNNRFPSQLSTGQRQRVAISRSIVRGHPILLLDEAFSSLDPPLRIEMLDMVKSIQKDKNLTMIMVTHNYNDAMRICDKICFMQDGQIIYINPIAQFAENAKSHTVKQYIAAAS